jgi:hypothetical protein
MATSLELAITAIRSGRKEEGRQLLNLLIQQNPNNEMAWLWMSSVVNTDEQRARCLYHVLAINPDNNLARRGLQILGIVVSDSRPVKIPRDSQPIPVQRPEPEAATPWPILPAAPAATPNPLDTQPLPPPPDPKTESAPAAPPEERRPFRLDPKTITQELPFVPLREPFAEPNRRSPSAFIPRAEADQPTPAIEAASPLPDDSPAPAAAAAPAVQPAPERALIPLTPTDVPLPDFPAFLPSSPKPPAPVTDTGPLPASTPPQAPASTPPQQQVFGPGVPVNETRPSQPIWVTHSNVTMSMPTPTPQNPQPYPAPSLNSNVTTSMPTPMPQNPQPYPAPSLNSNVTMGMPTHYLSPQNPIQGAPAIHSNATMGMPMPPNGQLTYPPEAMPTMPPNGAMGMLTYSPAPFQSPYPQNQVYHASPTMAMPTMTEAEARARLLAGQPIPIVADPYAALRMAAAPPNQAPQISKKGSKKVVKDEDEEEVNLLAVIVFGSLSVTALGGMGMLILLWFTSV